MYYVGRNSYPDFKLIPLIDSVVRIRWKNRVSLKNKIIKMQCKIKASKYTIFRGQRMQAHQTQGKRLRWETQLLSNTITTQECQCDQMVLQQRTACIVCQKTDSQWQTVLLSDLPFSKSERTSETNWVFVYVYLNWKGKTEFC